MSTLMWQFNTRAFRVEWRIEDDVLDTSYMDAETRAECLEKVASGEWQCFTSEIRVIHRASGRVLGESYLGNSIYAIPSEFRDHFGMRKKNHGSYFSDMVREAVAEARQEYNRLREQMLATQLHACTGSARTKTQEVVS